MRLFPQRLLGRRLLSRHLPVVCFLGLFLFLFVATLDDYGVTWDSALGELFVGDKYFYFLTSFDPDYLDLNADDIPVYDTTGHPDFFELGWYARMSPEQMWGFGPTLTAASKYLFYTLLGILDPIDAHHLILGLLAVLQFAAVYYLATRLLTPAAGLCGVLCLAVYPRYWAHIHNNPKDVPEAVLITLVIVLFCSGIGDHKTSRLWAGFVLAGLALATKANALFLPVILGPWLAAEIWQRRRRQEGILVPGMGWALVFGPFLAGAVAVVAWPYLLLNFPENLTAHLSYLLSRGAEGADRWQSIPIKNALFTMPLSILAMTALGTAVAFVDAVRSSSRRTTYLLLLLWMCIPVLRVSVPKARDFDVIRHWLEFLPALCLFAGLGIEFLVQSVSKTVGRFFPGSDRESQRLWLAGLMAVLVLSPVLAWNLKNHPFQLLYYNALVGGLGGAQRLDLPESSDYWGSSYRAGLRWLNEHAERDSVLFVGVAQHIVEFVRDIWLRKDIELHKIETMGDWLRRGSIAGRTGYLMYITRKGHHHPGMMVMAENGHEVFRTSVDGGTALYVVRLN